MKSRSAGAAMGRLAWLMLWAAAGTASTSAGAHLEPGAVAPDFTLPCQTHRKPFSLHEAGGHRLLVLVRPNQRFTNQVLEMCRRIPKRFSDSKEPWRPILVWVGAGSMEASSVSTPTLSAPWCVVHDLDGKIGRSYGMIVSPTVYIVNPQGAITHVFPAWHPLLETKILRALGAEPIREPPTQPQDMSEGERASLYFSMARAMAEQGHWEEALSHYDKGLALDPKAPRALGRASRAALMSLDRVKAKSLALRALDLDPREPLARAVLSNLQGHPVPLMLKDERDVFDPAVNDRPSPPPGASRPSLEE